MIALENATVQMIGDPRDEWLMVVGYPKPLIGWVASGMQSIEKTEKLSITHVANVTNVYRSWLPYGIAKSGMPTSKLFAVDIGMRVCHCGVWRIQLSAMGALYTVGATPPRCQSLGRQPTWSISKTGSKGRELCITLHSTI
jgi:hypothetical protein